MLGAQRSFLRFVCCSFFCSFAMAARLIPGQKVRSSNLSALILWREMVRTSSWWGKTFWFEICMSHMLLQLCAVCAAIQFLHAQKRKNWKASKSTLNGSQMMHNSKLQKLSKSIAIGHGTKFGCTQNNSKILWFSKEEKFMLLTSKPKTAKHYQKLPKS